MIVRNEEDPKPRPIKVRCLRSALRVAALWALKLSLWLWPLGED